MRHITRTVDTWDGGKHVVDTPYLHDYVNAYDKSGFKNASQKKVYVKFLRYIADHDGCTRKDILKGLGRSTDRGQNSSLFAQLLYLDLIDYDKNFKYHITDKGEEVLNAAYMNDMEKYVKDDKKWKELDGDDDKEEISESRKPIMKKLPITKKQFTESKYFQKKYGKLEYVSESGKLFKTDKGKVLMFKESSGTAYNEDGESLYEKTVREHADALYDAIRELRAVDEELMKKTGKPLIEEEEFRNIHSCEDLYRELVLYLDDIQSSYDEN